MPKKVISIREESDAEKALREWFAAQALESPRTLEEAARLLIGLVATLLGVLFSVLTLSAEKLPAYLQIPLVRWCGVATIGLWLVALLAGLMVVLPRQRKEKPARPDTQNQVFHNILKMKSNYLTLAVAAFGLAIIAFGIVLITALLSV